MFYFLKQVLQNVLSSMGLSRNFWCVFMIKKKVSWSELRKQTPTYTKKRKLFWYSKRVLSFYHRSGESMSTPNSFTPFPSSFFAKLNQRSLHGMWLKCGRFWQVHTYFQPLVLKDLLDCIKYPYSITFTAVNVLTAGLTITSTNKAFEISILVFCFLIPRLESRRSQHLLIPV